jgi:hypothetical protein
MEQLGLIQPEWSPVLGDIMTMTRPYTRWPLATLALGAAFAIGSAQAATYTNKQGTNSVAPPATAAPAPVVVPAAQPAAAQAPRINYSTGKNTHMHGTNANMTPEPPASAAPETVARGPRR